MDERLKHLNQNLRPIEDIPDALTDKPPLPEGTIVPDQLEDKLLQITPVQIAGRLRERTDTLFFHFGSVYELIRLEQDLMQQFRRDEIYQGPCEDLTFTRPILTGLHRWNSVIQAVPEGARKRLVQWTQGQAFIRSKESCWWRIRSQVIRIPDPVVIDAGGVLGPEDFIDVLMFLPYGNRGMTFVRQPENGQPAKITFKLGIAPPEGTQPPGWK